MLLFVLLVFLFALILLHSSLSFKDYSNVPNFDFVYDDIGQSSDLQHAYEECEADMSCVGFNTGN